MLVLGRKKNEKILIGELGDIEIVVIEIQKHKVRLGVRAPKEIPVHREEVFKSIAKDNTTKKRTDT